VTSLVDVDGLVRDRLQLWAEARDLYLAEGVLYEPAERLARDEHAKFKVQDGWLQRVSAWLDDEIEDGVSPRTGGNLLSGDVLRDCLNLKEPHTKRDQMRVAEVLKKLGMVKVLRRVTTSRFGGGYGRDLAPSKVWVDGSEDL
jgi:predicted P-loop ATPase